LILDPKLELFPLQISVRLCSQDEEADLGAMSGVYHRKS
jgi:hypothetical protein